METEKRGISFSGQELFQLILPLLIEQLLSITVGLADSLMVARVGEAAISAVSLVDTLNVLLVNGFASLATGGAVIVGQYMGQEEPEKAGHAGSQLLLFMTEVSLVIMILFYGGRNFLLHGVFGQVEADVAACADTYFLIVEASIPALALYSAGAALFRVMGNSSLSMAVSTLMNVINVIGNGVLIFGFHRGVEGVAIPTVVSRVVAAVLMLVLLRRPGLPVQAGKFPRHHDRKSIRNIIHFGVPNGLEGCMFQMGKILLLSTVSGMGTASVAANAVGNTMGNFHVLAGNAIGLGIVTVVSRCVGAGDIRQARHYTKVLMKAAYLCMAVINLLLIAALPGILWLYDLSAEATHYARIICLMHGIMAIFFWPLAFTLPQALRAAGDTRFTMLVSSLSMWLIRVMLGIWMGQQYGILGIWIAMFFDWFVRIAFFLLRFHGHRWERSGLQD